MASNRVWDDNLLLLSTDWFRGFWPMFGLVFSPSAGAAIQRSAQEAVTEMMTGAAEYWFVLDPSEQRVQTTRDRFVMRLQAAKVAKSDIDRLLRLMDSLTAAEADQTAATSWLFDSLFGMVARPETTAALTPLPEKISEIVRKEAEADSTPDVFDPWVFRDRALASGTPWDRYVRSITSDLPDHTATLASARLRNLDGFQGKWTRIAAQLDHDERQVLVNWLLSEGKKLAHEEFRPNLPEWMK